jgi:ssDNA-binding Zn-finger/Zn-ribbon topoisomerase 1
MSGYHFHKDCKHFPECTEELTRNQGHEVIKFICPAGGVVYYYKGDLHSIKWDCGAYEPSQTDINCPNCGCHMVELQERSGEE